MVVEGPASGVLQQTTNVNFVDQKVLGKYLNILSSVMSRGNTQFKSAPTLPASSDKILNIVDLSYGDFKRGMIQEPVSKGLFSMLDLGMQVAVVEKYNVIKLLSLQVIVGDLLTIPLVLFFTAMTSYCSQTSAKEDEAADQKWTPILRLSENCGLQKKKFVGVLSKTSVSSVASPSELCMAPASFQNQNNVRVPSQKDSDADDSFPSKPNGSQQKVETDGWMLTAARDKGEDDDEDHDDEEEDEEEEEEDDENENEAEPGEDEDDLEGEEEEADDEGADDNGAEDDNGEPEEDDGEEEEGEEDEDEVEEEEEEDVDGDGDADEEQEEEEEEDDDVEQDVEDEEEEEDAEGESEEDVEPPRKKRK